MTGEPEVYSVSAKNEVGRKIDLKKIVEALSNASYNEGFKGGRVEIKIYLGNDRIGTIELYSSGKFNIRAKSKEDVLLASSEFIRMLQML